MNEILFFLSIILTFSGVVLIEKIFKDKGLYMWVALAPVMANILTSKQITIFNLDVTMGTVLFASVFLATDIMNEKYGEKEAKKASWLAFVSVLCYIVIARISLIFIPNDFDFAKESMNTLFGTSIRISIVSAILLLLANLLDVFIYNIIKKKSKFVWLRNNISTMVCNCIENFLFVFLAFYGIMPIKDLLLIALGTTIIEIITSICDTPFLYLAIKIKDKKQSTLI